MGVGIVPSCKVKKRERKRDRDRDIDIYRYRDRVNYRKKERKKEQMPNVRLDRKSDDSLTRWKFLIKNRVVKFAI